MFATWFIGLGVSGIGIPPIARRVNPGLEFHPDPSRGTANPLAPSRAAVNVRLNAQ
jgi:hypothetical protein